MEEILRTEDVKRAFPVAGGDFWALKGISITVPKNTFPGNGSTIYWYLEGTDTGGYTSQTSVTSFKTVTSQITAQDSPTSGYRDPRYAITFSWYFATPKSTYDQASAALHWRVSGASSWNDVAASGSTQSVTIAANTFPLASTIEWYLRHRDWMDKIVSGEYMSYYEKMYSNNI